MPAARESFGKKIVMETFAWILKGLVAFIFLFSGFNKALFDEKKLVAKGQTGVEGLPKAMIKFIGISEILGATGLVLPALLNFGMVFIPLSAICLGAIMFPAAWIHFKRGEMKNVGVNAAILVACTWIACFHLF